MIKQLREIVGKLNIYEHYSLKKCTSFGIGGNARFYATPRTVEELFNLIDFSNKNNLKFKIIGNGTNLLFSDNGFNGLVVSLRKMTSAVVVDGCNILASAGASLDSLINLAKENFLSGLEFATGIPGSLGGAIVMNAGAGGSELASILKTATILEYGEIKTINAKDLKFGYRSSYFLNNSNAIILFAELNLKKVANKNEIEEKMLYNKSRRFKTQPTQRSAGCVFKKCGDSPAGQLIDQAGLKNKSCGGARVSDIHANFIVNDGDATAEDVKQLIHEIQLSVWNKYNKRLELEIEIID